MNNRKNKYRYSLQTASNQCFCVGGGGGGKKKQSENKTFTKVCKKNLNFNIGGEK